MTTDYSALDTAALVAAAEALTAGITPGVWEWESEMRDVGLGIKVRYMTGLISVRKIENYETPENREVLAFVGRSAYANDPDAAFIAAAPALVKALVARLRECGNG